MTACVNILIVDDDILEGNESFIISLENTTDLDSRICLSSGSAEVTILDDDLMTEGTGGQCCERVRTYSNISFWKFDYHILAMLKSPLQKSLFNYDLMVRYYIFYSLLLVDSHTSSHILLCSDSSEALIVIFSMHAKQDYSAWFVSLSVITITSNLAF